MLGEIKKEANWLLIAINTSTYNTRNQLKEFADKILSDIINCETAFGFNDIKIPGEIERNNKINSDNKIYLPKKPGSNLLQLFPNKIKIVMCNVKRPHF